MSVVPINHAWTAGTGLVHEDPFATSKRWQKRYGPAEINQFLAAEMIAEKWDLDRPTMEAFALRSHQSALTAINKGYFAAEIEPYGEFSVDECPRQTSMEKMATLPTLSEGGRMTAALASQISDASAALLVCSESALKEHGLTPRARIHTITVAADDPIMMLTAPIPATRKALQKSGLSLGDIDLIEINEAFASVVLAWQKELDVDPDRINVNGGAIALGHPIGASGARLMTSMLSELERRGARFGLQTMCEGGGQANVTIIERV
jgi:acetyl-CoA C-acetyltransferase